MTATELAAWWGAGIATLVLAWDIYKWRKSGENITLTATPNMQSYGAMPSEMDDKTYVVVVVTNTGDKKSTLTHLVGFQYNSYIGYLLNKSISSFFVTNAALVQPLPHALEPGEQWQGIIEQNSDLENMSRSGRFYCGVYHSNNKKPVLRRVVIA